MRVVSSAKTKLILFGEHAAVYGYPAIGHPLPWKLEITLSPAEEMKWNSASLEERHKKKLDHLLGSLPEIFPELSKAPPFEISITSDAPIGVGLGSSAALTVALTRAIFLFVEKEIETQLIWERAHALEKIFHKTPSGIDTGISAYEALSAFEGQNGKLPLRAEFKSASLPLVIGALPRDSDTATLVSGLKMKKDTDKNTVFQLEKLGGIAARAISKFGKNPLAFSEIGELAWQAQEILQSLGLSTDSLDKMLEAGRKLNALGGKLSGAGGGGAYFLIAKDRLSANKLARALKLYAEEHAIFHSLLPSSI